MGAEFALVAVDRSLVQHAAAAGDRRAGRVAGALGRLSFHLSGAQLGITWTSLAVGAIAEPTLGRALEPVISALPFVAAGTALGVSVAVALALATIAQMILGELVPKNLAIARPWGSSLYLVGPLRWHNRLLRLLIAFLNGSANRAVRLLGIEPREELAAARSVEELDLLVRSSAEQGGVSEAEARLFARAVRFQEKRASDVLVPRGLVAAIGEDTTVAELAELSLRRGFSRLPIHRGTPDELVGVAHIKDVYRIPEGERARTPVAAIAREVPIVPESRDLASLLTEMRQEGRPLVVVVDEFGATAGIVTLEDILEEIVGEIQDEHDRAGEPSGEVSPQGYRVLSGRATRDGVRELLGVDLPEGDFKTLAGFLLARLGRLARVGDRVSWQGWDFRVLKVQGKRIASVAAIPPAQRRPS